MAGSLNKVMLIGNLGRDPEVRSFQNGGKVCNLTIATSERWRDKSTGEKLPDEVDIGRRIADAAQARGLFVRPIGHLNVMSPALILTRTQAEFIVETLAEAIKSVTDGLVKDGVRIG